jgi:hypothetical protein
MGLEDWRNSRLWKLIADIHVLHWILGFLAALAGLVVTKAASIFGRPLHIALLYGFAGAALLFVALHFGWKLVDRIGVTNWKKDALDVHFTRTHLMPRNLFHDMSEQVMKLAGHDVFESEADFMYQIFLVNRTNKPITIKKFVCRVQFGDEWKEVPIVEDLSTYQLKFEEDGKPRWEDLVSLQKKLEGVVLTYGVGYKGWLRFKLVAENTFLKGKIISVVDIVDALGKTHPVLSLKDAEKYSGTLVHNPKKVFES